MGQALKAIINILCLLCILFLPGSGMILLMFIHDRALLMHVLRGKRNIITVIEEVLYKSYKQWRKK